MNKIGTWVLFAVCTLLIIVYWCVIMLPSYLLELLLYPFGRRHYYICPNCKKKSNRNHVYQNWTHWKCTRCDTTSPIEPCRFTSPTRCLVYRIIATWFFSGLIPPIILKGMAGTYGSLCSLPLCYLALWVTDGSTLYYSGIVVAVFIIGCWSIPDTEEWLGPVRDWKGKVKEHDQNQIVVDEVLGMLVACFPMIFVSPHRLWLALTLAFVLFRFFDIVKVPPTRFFDRMSNAYGVMLDDVVAGIYSAILLWLAVIFIGV